MSVSVDRLKAWFDEFNARYFNGELPRPAFSTGMSRTRLGSMSWRKERHLFRQVAAFSIRISNYYDVDETTFKSVLLHEMIHLYIVSRGIKDTSAHGKEFRRHMNRLNADGWKITVSARVTGVPVTKRGKTCRAKIVLAVITNDGRHVLSVVNPRYVTAIDRAMRRAANVKSLSWHISTDNYFSVFPVVRTPKGRVVTRETYVRLLAGMCDLKLP